MFDSTDLEATGNEITGLSYSYGRTQNRSIIFNSLKRSIKVRGVVKTWTVYLNSGHADYGTYYELYFQIWRPISANPTQLVLVYESDAMSQTTSNGFYDVPIESFTDIEGLNSTYTYFPTHGIVDIPAEPNVMVKAGDVIGYKLIGEDDGPFLTSSECEQEIYQVLNK